MNAGRRTDRAGAPARAYGARAADLVRLMAGGPFPGVSIFTPAVACTLLWPVADWLLLAPQRRAVERDENRPL